LIPKFFSRPVLIFFTVITALALFLPQNFVILAPGPTSNLLGGAISIKGVSDNSNANGSTGALYSTAIYATSPGEFPFGFEVIQAWLDGDLVVMPRDALYDKKEKPKAAAARQKQEMVDSQINGAIAALNFIKSIPTYPKPTWSESDVKIVLDKVGGGSAGLAFALALIAKSVDPQLVAGRKIAATGTISQNGKVGAIGGVDQKILAAKKSGVQIFLAPKSNCSKISKHPKGLEIYGVNNLSEAVHVLAGNKSAASAC
jgi:PDZ domain-containing protein